MKAFQIKYSILIVFILINFIQSSDNGSVEYVTIAILAKDKAHTLPLYLACIENQTWPQDKTYLYIRTNNNNDCTGMVLKNWIERVRPRYAKIYFDDEDVAEPVQQFKQHEWNYTRFKVLGKIRQDSVNWAKENKSHYFVVDCDNFICSDTLESMIKAHVPIIAPFLKCYRNPYYANYHEAIDENGYYASSSFYYDILEQRIKGIIEVPVVHCTYLVRYEVLDTVCYDDESARYEYVIFSDSARRKDIPQYIDNRKLYGYVSFAEEIKEFEEEHVILSKELLK